MKNKWNHSIIYKTAFAFSLMSLLTVWLLSSISYFFFSSQYTKNIKTSLINQYQILQTEIQNDGTNRTLEEEIPTLTNEWFMIFSNDSDKPFYYHGLYIPFTKKWFYRMSWKNWNVWFYTDIIKWKDMFLGKKMDEFEQTRTDYTTILIIINSTFLFILIALSLILSRNILKPISKLAEYLLGYRFTTDNAEKLYQDGQLFEIGILTKAFDTAIHYTQQSVQKEKEFLQDASHELRTPLMWISSSIELLKTTDLTTQQQEKLDIIQLLNNKLQKITDELLFLTRGKHQWYTNQKIQLSKEIHTIIKWYKEAIKKKKIRVSITLDDETIISASEMHIHKLFSNLIDNAIKYTPQWWNITISLHKGIFSIQDTGIGMSKTFISRLGERFIRERQATKINYEGIGLWLSIVYKIIQEYTRKIDIQSNEWKGTRIKIVFTDTDHQKIDEK